MQLLVTRKGKVELIEAPDPVPAENELLIETVWSAMSAGTEQSAIAQHSTSLFSLVQRGIQSWEKIRRSLARRGWRQTLARVEEAVDKTVPLGYSLTGRVLRTGTMVDEFHAGDWVAAVGVGAHHGTLAAVPRLLCARLPKPQQARDAAVAALACVGIHAIHRAELAAGSETAVFGLGAVGQFTVQALLASGGRVVGFDPVEPRRTDAAQAGAEVHDPATFDFEQGNLLSSHGQGLDAVFLCAKTDSPDLMRQAAALCRKRGKLIIVGEFPIELPRDEAYEKELEVRISAAYGEGRYDPSYERLDQDYPVAQGRWTVRRNLELFLRWLEEGRIKPSLLHPQVTPLNNAASVYSGTAATAAVLHIFDHARSRISTPSLQTQPRSMAGPSAVPIAVVGTGRFVVETHLPNLRQASDKFHLHTVVGKTPAKAAQVAVRFGAGQASCDLAKILSDPGIRALLIATPHRLHAGQVIEGLKAGKHVFVEKPLCIQNEELAEIRQVCRNHRTGAAPVLFTGFNRRYAPVSRKLAEERAASRVAVQIRYTFQLEPLPPGDWAAQPEQGGRFVGEICHAVDWILWIVGQPLRKRQVVPQGVHGADIHLEFEDGSRAHLRWEPVFRLLGAKEQVEIRWEDVRWRLEDFRSVEIFKRDSMIHRDRWESKGHREVLDAFAAAIAQPGTGEDPHGFLASSQMILELDLELKAFSV